MNTNTDIERGDEIVVVKGSHRGQLGVVTDVGGECAGETAAMVLLRGKRTATHTFMPVSYLVRTK